MNKDLKSKTIEQLEELVIDSGGKKYLAKYIFTFIHAQDAAGIDDITPLPKALRQNLAEQGYFISQLKTVEQFSDPDGTIKFLFEAGDGTRFESVILIDDGEASRKTLCISCQAGCRMACTFCATARLKFTRDLTAGEIADQLNQVAKQCGKINNVVYMGMGEPFDNYDEVMQSVRIINHQAGKSIGQRHITVSTCGITDGIDRFAAENLQVRLAISLHAPNDQIRKRLIPATAEYPLDKLIQSAKSYQQETQRRITFEYCMIDGLNDSLKNAAELAKLLRGIKAGINLIEYNPHKRCKFKPSSRQKIQQFKDALMQAGFETIIRYKRGQKINAACGQLGATWLNNPR